MLCNKVEKINVPTFINPFIVTTFVPEIIMEKIQWKVDGIHCANCALTINKFLSKEGAQNISVNPIDGDVSFELNGNASTTEMAKGMQSLGYKVNESGNLVTSEKLPFLSTNLQRFWFCLPFTLLLMLHMIPGIHIHLLMNPYVQLALTLPVFITGMRYFA